MESLERRIFEKGWFRAFLGEVAILGAAFIALPYLVDWSRIVKVLRVSPFWLGAGWLPIVLTLWAAPGFGAEVTIFRGVTVHGQNLRGQLVQPVAAMKQELTSQGCNRVAVAFWTTAVPTRIRVEVRCVSWRWRLPLDPWAIRQLREAPTAGLPR